ncbi:hypothetical protein HPB47_021837, partial [Ixodes persulcatus]
DILAAAPTSNQYDNLKAAILARKTTSERSRLQHLLNMEELGDQRPSQLLRRMRQLLGDATSDADTSLLRELFLQRLPNNMVVVLAAAEDMPLERLADLADRVAEYSTPPVVAATSFQSRTSDPAAASPSQDIAARLSRLEKAIQDLQLPASRTLPIKTILCTFGTHLKTSAARPKEGLCDIIFWDYFYDSGRGTFLNRSSVGLQWFLEFARNDSGTTQFGIGIDHRYYSGLTCIQGHSWVQRLRDLQERNRAGDAKKLGYIILGVGLFAPRNGNAYKYMEELLRPPNSYSVLDVTAHSPSLEMNWELAPDTRGSDHFSIHITIKGCRGEESLADNPGATVNILFPRGPRQKCQKVFKVVLRFLRDIGFKDRL